MTLKRKMSLRDSYAAKLRAGHKPKPRQKNSRQGGIFCDDRHLSFVRTLPCCVCSKKGVQAHHVIARGMGGARRDDRLAVPLCVECHTAVHTFGQKTFALRFAVDLPAIAEQIWDSRLTECGKPGMVVVQNWTEVEP